MAASKGWILGVCGRNGSGKSTVSQFLQSYLSCQVLSLSNAIRYHLCHHHHEEPPYSRQRLIDVGNEMRVKDGADALAKATLKRLAPDARCVIESIRHPKEAEALQLGGRPFLMLHVKAPPKLRYERIVSRKREGEVISEEDFFHAEQLELKNPNSHGQQLLAVFEKADLEFENNTQDIQEMEKRLQKIVDECILPQLLTHVS